MYLLNFLAICKIHDPIKAPTGFSRRAADVLAFENIFRVWQYHQSRLEIFPHLFYSQLNCTLFPAR